MSPVVSAPDRISVIMTSVSFNTSYDCLFQHPYCLDYAACATTRCQEPFKVLPLEGPCAKLAAECQADATCKKI